MPSPETVKVLGHYLHDERDTPPSETGDSNFLPENAYLACAALANMGLRVDPPLPDSGITRWRHDVDEIRAWYAKVASGEIPFSFKGQSVEHRFKPDGTWETTLMANPPDDAPEMPEVVPPDERREKPQAPDTHPPGQGAGSGRLRNILGGVTALLMLAGVWLVLRRHCRPA